MGRRRRYDTEALVERLRSERRTEIVAALLGFSALAGAAYYYMSGMRGPDVPTVPGQSASRAPNPAGQAIQPQPVDPTPEPVPTEPAAEEVAPTEEVAQNGTLEFKSNKKVVVWLDGDKLGRFRKKQMEVSAGTHIVKAKFGKKVVEEALELDEGGKLRVVVNPKKKIVRVRNLAR